MSKSDQLASQYVMPSEPQRRDVGAQKGDRDEEVVIGGNTETEKEELKMIQQTIQ